MHEINGGKLGLVILSGHSLIPLGLYPCIFEPVIHRILTFLDRSLSKDCRFQLDIGLKLGLHESEFVMGQLFFQHIGRREFERRYIKVVCSLPTIRVRAIAHLKFIVIML